MGACCSSTADPVLIQTLNHVDFTPAFTQGNAASALAQVHQAGGKVVVQRDHKNKSSVVKVATEGAKDGDEGKALLTMKDMPDGFSAVVYDASTGEPVLAIMKTSLANFFAGTSFGADVWCAKPAWQGQQPALVPTTGMNMYKWATITQAVDAPVQCLDARGSPMIMIMLKTGLTTYGATVYGPMGHNANPCALGENAMGGGLGNLTGTFYFAKGVDVLMALIATNVALAHAG